MHGVTISLLPVTGEVTRRRQRLSKRRDVLQHIDEEEENDPNSEKSTTGNQCLTQQAYHILRTRNSTVFTDFTHVSLLENYT